MMKKIFTILAASAMMLIGSNAYAQLSIGAGYLNSTAKSKLGNNVTATPSNGFYVGGEYLISEGAGFGVSVGAYYEYISNSKGIASGIFSASAKSTEMYLDIPVRFNYSAELSHSLRGFVFAGPNFSLGLSSQSQGSASIGGISGSTGKHDLYADSDYNRFDILLGGGIGVDYNNTIRFKLGYDLGMLNRYNSETAVLNRNLLHVGVAFLF